MESIELPRTLPLLPLTGQVLLPTAFVRVQVSRKAARSVALLEHLSAQSARELLVAVVPSLAPRDAREDGVLSAPLGEGGGPRSSSAPVSLDRLCPVGTAARVLQLSRLVQTGDWVVLLEGICRISITGLADGTSHSSSSSSSKGPVGWPGTAAAGGGGGGGAAGAEPPYDFVTIQQLELLPHGPFGSSADGSSSSGGAFLNSSSGGGFGLPLGGFGASKPPAGSLPALPYPSFGGGGTSSDALTSSSSGSSAGGSSGSSAGGSSGSSGSSSEDVEQLGAALKASTKVLLQLLSAASGLPAARRLLEMLAGVPAWRAADVVAAALARTNQERLAVLLALDPATRIKLALQQVQAALDAVGAANGSSSSSSNGSSGGGSDGSPQQQQQVVPGGRGSRGGSAVPPGASPNPNPGSSNGNPGSSKGDPQRKQQQQRVQIGPGGLIPGGGGGGAGRRQLPPGFWGIGPGAGGGSFAGEDEEGTEDEIQSLLSRLAAARPPPEVLKAAAREAKRLKSGGDHQPGAAAARAYLELLADLPWNTLAWQTAAASAAAAGGAAGGDSTAATGRKAAATAAVSAGAGKSKPPAAGSGSSKPGSDLQQQHLAAEQQQEARGPPSPMPLTAARALLDAHHTGLDKVKGRVVEHLAVSRLLGPANRGQGRAPVLCLIGPPGVGKTSLARSIAEVLGVPLSRIALGGVRDEAEIRGHRRTYVGAMPGRLIAAVRKAGCRDPLVLLDEVDKMGHDHRGDPAAALLEVLDPEQNHAFTDTYLGLPFDLSGVTFVATANRAADIPPALMDRLEVIHLPGYTLREKVSISQAHLLPSVLAEHGLGPQLVAFPRITLEGVVNGYTREAGVRGLRRCLAAICRHVALTVVMEHEQQAAAAAAAAATAAAAAAAGGVAEADLQQQGQQQHLGPPEVQQHSTVTVTAEGLSGLEQQQQQQQQQQQGWWSKGSSEEPLLFFADELPCAVLPASDHSSLLWQQQFSGVLQQQQQQQQQQQLSSSPGVSVTAWSVSEGPAGNSSSSSSSQGSGLRVKPQALPRLKRQAGLSAAAAAVGAAADGSSSGSSASALSSALSRGVGQQQQQQQQYALTAPLSQPPPPQQQQQQQQHMLTRQQLQQHQRASSVRYDGTPAGGVDPYPYPPDLLTQAQARIVVDMALVETVLGPPKFTSAAEELGAAVSTPGVVAGLVWTSAGGGVQCVECVAVTRGEGHSQGALGQLTLTGQVGEVLEESARIALSWIRAHAWELGLLDAPLTLQQQQHQQQQRERPRGEAAVPPVLLQLSPQQQQQQQQQGQSGALQLLGAGQVPGDGLVNPDSHSSYFSSLGRLLSTAQQQQQQQDPQQDPQQWRQPASQPEPSFANNSSSGSSSSTSGGPYAGSPLSWDLHVHLPAGAVPKDGPSAGITLAVALLSRLSGRVVRADTAMTGEMTLSGLVLPVGGIKEKLLAARAAGLKRALVPARNMREVELHAQEATQQQQQWDGEEEDGVDGGCAAEGCDASSTAATAGSSSSSSSRDGGSGLEVVPVSRLEDVLAAAFDPPFLLRSRSRM